MSTATVACIKGAYSLSFFCAGARTTFTKNRVWEIPNECFLVSIGAWLFCGSVKQGCLSKVEEAVFLATFLNRFHVSFRRHFLQSRQQELPLKKGVTSAGLPDFSWYNIPKREKYTKWLQNIPNGYKIYQMAIKYTNIFNLALLNNGVLLLA
jgi:hypothetical protein